MSSHSSVFPCFVQNPDNIANVKLFAGLLLLHHLESTKTNYCALLATLTMKNPTTQITETKKEGVACGFEVLQGFINHSCNGNIYVIYNRRSALTYSLRPIKAGEQVCGHSCDHIGDIVYT